MMRPPCAMRAGNAQGIAQPPGAHDRRSRTATRPLQCVASASWLYSLGRVMTMIPIVDGRPSDVSTGA